MKNDVEIRGNKVIKTFANRADYLNEDKIYGMLAGTGLVPELLYSYDGCIEHVLVRGDNLYELLQAAQNDLSKVAALLDKFCSWYLAFREKTGLILGGIRFEKFILAQDRLVCIDLESCKKGYIESDFASLIARICMRPTPFSEKGLLIARLFTGLVADRINWDPLRLARELSTAIPRECRLRGVRADLLKTEYIITCVTMAGVIMAGGDHPIEECSQMLSYLPERVISVPSGGKAPLAGGFRTVQSEYPDECLSGRLAEALEGITQPWTFVLSTDMPAIPQLLRRTMLSESKREVDAVMIEAAGKLRDFPVLLRTETSLPELRLAASEGRDSVVSAISGRRIKVVRLEDLEAKSRAY